MEFQSQNLSQIRCRMGTLAVDWLNFPDSAPKWSSPKPWAHICLCIIGIQQLRYSFHLLVHIQNMKEDLLLKEQFSSLSLNTPVERQQLSETSSWKRDSPMRSWSSWWAEGGHLLISLSLVFGRCFSNKACREIQILFLVNGLNIILLEFHRGQRQTLCLGTVSYQRTHCR